jgi:hypothetical protein
MSEKDKDYVFTLLDAFIARTSGPASKFRCPKLDLLPAGVTKNNFRSYGYASDFSFSQRPKYLRF